MALQENYINLALKYNNDVSSNSDYVDKIKQLAIKLKDKDYTIKKNFLQDKIKSQNCTII